MFKIIGADQKEYGPVTPDQIRQWIAEGRANAQTRVQREGETEWKPLSSHAEFAPALGAAPAPAAPPPFAQPPGDHTVLPPDVLERDYDLDIGSCISRGWELVKNNFGVLVGAVAVFMLCELVIGGLSVIPIIGALFSLANLFVVGPLMGGTYYLVLKVIRGRPAEIGDIFAGFKLRLVHLMLAYLVTLLISGVLAIPGAIMMGIPLFLMIGHHQMDGGSMALAILGLFVALIPLIYLTTSWLFSLPLVIDKQLDFWPAMQTSRKVVHKHWWTVFALLIVCALVNMVGVCACYVGIFFTTPIIFAAMMYAYEDLFTRPT
jgi:hypothetical protein